MGDQVCNTPSRSPLEVGSPEFSEDRTQINSLNNKWIFESAMSRFWDAAVRSGDHLADLQSRSLQSLDQLLDLQTKVNAKFFEGVDDRAESTNALRAQARRHADDNAYVTRYDLSNPVTTGAGDTLRSAAYTPNRATDTASAGVGVSAEAVAAAVAKQVDATITPVLAALQETVQALATATTAIANTVNQAQPKTA